MGSPASRGIFCAKDLLLFSLERNAMNHGAARSQRLRQESAIYAVKLRQQIWRR
jgi:hypothetical protein